MAVLALSPLAGHAQDMGANGIHPVVGRPKFAAPPPPAPSGLPGATAPAGGVAPAQVPAADMSPNDALFDAINRGDIVAARDAMGRGAELNAHNILGMTPIELSVDLSRNDITFYLLSLRSADATTAPPPAKPAASVAARKPVAKPAAVKVVQKPAPPPPPAAPQFAGGGTPDPRAGFLGFGTTVR